MNKIVFILLLLCTTTTKAQDSFQVEIKDFVLNYYKAFNNFDLITLNKMIENDPSMITVYEDKDGNVNIKDRDYLKYIIALASGPKGTKINIKILSLDIKANLPFAQVWTDYQFFLNDTLSHCGGISFQLVKKNNAWKIFTITDARTKGVCK